MQYYDKIIIGAGLYGLYSALYCGKKNEKILVLECEPGPFQRATYVNQARIHQGYHYPRSISTAIKSANYFERFNNDYGFCINNEFTKIYATSSNQSWTNADQFEKFCKNANIKCDRINPETFFKKGLCDGAFITREYAYDAKLLETYFINEINKYKNIELKYNFDIVSIDKDDKYYSISSNNETYYTPYLLNATYASTNQIIEMIGFEKFKIKYELCEIILCEVNDKLLNYGITVMDGPFFSIMPFGIGNTFSLTSVTFTPHTTSFDSLPTFDCQKLNKNCSPNKLANCNTCLYKPKSAFEYMNNLAKKYLKSEYVFTYKESLFSMKPILMASEIDDSRPTVVKVFSKNPTFVSVLSGKINTVYDLDEVLNNE